MSYAIGSELLPHNQDFLHDQRTTLSQDSSRIRSSSLRQRTFQTKMSGAISPDTFPIIAHCHLCWDWVWQRPQQFLSRLSARHGVLFIETLGPDAQLASPTARFRTLDKFPNIAVLQIQFPAWRWNDGAFVDRERWRLVKEFLSGPGSGRFDNPVQWFYDPMAVPAFLGRMNEIATVYDCMDELSKFSCAPPEIAAREAQLLAAADVVFTGGRKLFELKSQANSNCHFYGCGVDANHFGAALKPETQLPADLAEIPEPRLGYFGVVDERMDYELIVRLAEAHPEWSLVMVGPTIKVDSTALPRRKNIHWLGARAYEQLPAYCKGFRVCLMPFARNEATEYINPTKALEYMAAGRPIVSSAIADVVRNFGNVAKIAKSRNEFISLCEQAVQHQDSAAIERGLKLAAENSWESIVSRLEDHVRAAILKKGTTRVIA